MNWVCELGVGVGLELAGANIRSLRNILRLISTKNSRKAVPQDARVQKLEEMVLKATEQPTYNPYFEDLPQ